MQQVPPRARVRRCADVGCTALDVCAMGVDWVVERGQCGAAAVPRTPHRPRSVSPDADYGRMMAVRQRPDFDAAAEDSAVWGGNLGSAAHAPSHGVPACRCFLCDWLSPFLLCECENIAENE
jgi:hypothetical protein